MGLGGNTPGTLEAFNRTRRLFSSLFEAPQFSSLYRTVPLLDTNQESFWNAVAEGYWSGSAESLLERLLMFEAGQGRERIPSRPKGPRVLDLDLLTYGALIQTTSRLILPHPGIRERRFVLEPLLEVQPDGRDPCSRLFWRQIAEALPDQGVDRVDRTW